MDLKNSSKIDPTGTPLELGLGIPSPKYNMRPKESGPHTQGA